MLKIFLILFISSSLWASKLKISKPGDLLSVLSLYKESSPRSDKEKANTAKCHGLFRTNTDFNNWQESITAEKKAKINLTLLKNRAKEVEIEFLIAKKERESYEKAFKRSNSQTHDQTFTHFETALSRENNIYEDKKLAKEMLKEAKKDYQKAKKKRKILEELFKKSRFMTL